MKFNTFQVRGETCFNRNVWIKAASRFEIGMTLEACIEIFLNTELTHKAQQELSPIDRLVQHIGRPHMSVFQRTKMKLHLTIFV